MNFFVQQLLRGILLPGWLERAVRWGSIMALKRAPDSGEWYRWERVLLHIFIAKQRPIVNRSSILRTRKSTSHYRLDNWLILIRLSQIFLLAPTDLTGQPVPSLPETQTHTQTYLSGKSEFTTSINANNPDVVYGFIFPSLESRLMLFGFVYGTLVHDWCQAVLWFTFCSPAEDFPKPKGTCFFRETKTSFGFPISLGPV